MKFIASTKSLLSNLQAIGGVVSNNSTLPILENFMFRLNPGSLTVQASDLENSMSVEIPVESQESGNVAIPSKILLDTLKNLPDQPLTFNIDDRTFAVSIQAENGVYKLNGLSGEDFPKIPQAEDTQSIEIPAEVLTKAFQQTMFAASTDELRRYLTGIFIELSPEQINFVTADGHRLAKYTRSDLFANYSASFILPKKAANLLKTALSPEHTVEMSHNMSNAFFSFGNIKLVSRLIEGRYPDYNAAIPAENPNILSISRADWLSALKRISIFANKTTHQIILKLTSSEVILSSQDLDFSNEASERIQCTYNGADMDIAFNAKFLIEMLNTADSDDVEFKMSMPNRAGILIPVDQEEKENILMLAMSNMIVG